ncbi:MAG TPA: VTT domain-containing protein [Gemmatimonadaceae bacterium]|nr:VTT domain-containing protein [Gemmatimonadaceae bacterium]
MQLLSELFHALRDPTTLITTVGTVGVVGIIFVETGLLFPMLPGDSLLVTAGLLASQSEGPVRLNVWLLGVLCSCAAIAGNSTGYYIGRRAGRALFQREDSRIFKRSHLLRAQAFYERHGGKTIILAQFMPIVRTFAPVVAGAAEMRYLHFITFNVIGALTWIWSMLLLGYFLAKRFPVVGEHIELVIVVVVVVSVSPGIIGWWRHRTAKDSLQ